MIEPQHYAWVVNGKLAVAERPGGGGRAHRIARRDGELEWWRVQGIALVISAMRTRHGLLDAALAGMHVRWHPLVDLDQGPPALLRLADAVERALAQRQGPVLVHVDRPGEWCAAVDAALRLRFGLAEDVPVALAQAAEDGFAVGDLAGALVSAFVPGSGLPAQTAWAD